MPVIRNDTGEIKLGWRLILIVFLYVAVAVLLRFIPIRLYTAVLVNDGMAQGNALEKASSIILEDPVWYTAIGVLSGLMGLLIVWFLVRVIEKSSFTWKTVGLDWRSNSLLVILLGAILALLLFVASILTGYILGFNSSSLNVLMKGVSIPIFFQNIVLYLAMGFGEEVVFRGYVQTRLVERYRAIWGIIITAVVFVLLHMYRKDNASPDRLSMADNANKSKPTSTMLFLHRFVHPSEIVRFGWLGKDRVHSRVFSFLRVQDVELQEVKNPLQREGKVPEIIHPRPMFSDLIRIRPPSSLYPYIAVASLYNNPLHSYWLSQHNVRRGSKNFRQRRRNIVVAGMPSNVVLVPADCHLVCKRGYCHNSRSRVWPGRCSIYAKPERIPQ